MSAHLFNLRQWPPFIGSVAVAEGAVTRSQLRSGSVRRLVRNVYQGVDLPVDHGVIATSALMVSPSHGVLTGHSGAWGFGVRVAAVDDPVLLAMPEDAHGRGCKEVRVHRAPLRPEETVLVDGRRVATPTRIAWDQATLIRGDDAVVLVDGLLHAGLVTPADLAAALDVRVWGRRIAQRCFALADGRAESPQETRMRLIVARSGIAGGVPQVVVRHDGRFVARVDLGWEAQKVAVEYDGLHHAGSQQFAADRARWNRLVEAGWTIVFVTAADLRSPAAFLATLRAALATARR